MARLLTAAMLLASPALHCAEDEKPAELKNHIGNLEVIRGQDYDFVQGDVVDCRSVSINYLVGDVRGERTQRLFVNVMRGDVQRGQVTINVLEGNIINGDNVTVNLLIGTDFSGRARVREIIDPDDL